MEQVSINDQNYGCTTSAILVVELSATNSRDFDNLNWCPLSKGIAYKRENTTTR